MREREQIVDAPDGWRLHLLDLEPPSPIGVVVAGHAMMVDRRTLWRAGRPSIAGTLLEHGFRVLLPDQRGHGQSGPLAAEGGDWSYADLVADTQVYLDLARQLALGLPLVLLGHSLFGHVALAHLGQRPNADIAAFVGMAVNIWCRQFDSTEFRWLEKYLAMGSVDLLLRAWGYVPAARLGFGSTDEAPTYWRDLAGFMDSGIWGIPGGIDYRAGLPNVRCPSLYVVSDGDTLFGQPDDSLAFSAPLPRRRVWRLGTGCERRELRGLSPGHMALVTSRAAEPIWRAVAGWLVAALGKKTGDARKRGNR